MKSSTLWNWVFGPTVIIVFLAGMLLPGTQHSGHSSPVVAAVTSILFFLEYPVRLCGLEDADAGMLAVRMFSTLVCGAIAGGALMLGAKLLLDNRKADSRS